VIGLTENIKDEIKEYLLSVKEIGSSIAIVDDKFYENENIYWLVFKFNYYKYSGYEVKNIFPTFFNNIKDKLKKHILSIDIVEDVELINRIRYCPIGLDTKIGSFEKPNNRIIEIKCKITSFVSRSNKSGLWDFKEFNENISNKGYWNNELIAASIDCNLGRIKEALKNGANIDFQDDNNDTNALGWAAFKGCLEVVEFLISKGANINITNSSNETPLNVATYKNYFGIIKYLISKGANIFIKDRWSETPIDTAYQQAHHKILNYLVDYVLKNHPERIEYVAKYASDEQKKEYSKLFREYNTGLWDLKTEEFEYGNYAEKIIDYISNLGYRIKKFRNEKDGFLIKMFVENFEDLGLSKKDIKNIENKFKCTIEYISVGMTPVSTFYFYKVYLPKTVKRSVDSGLWDLKRKSKDNWKEEIREECEKKLRENKKIISRYWSEGGFGKNIKIDDYDLIIYALKMFMGINLIMIFNTDEFNPEDEKCDHYWIWEKWDDETIDMGAEAETEMDKWIEETIIKTIDEEPTIYNKHKKFFDYLEKLDMINLPEILKRSSNSGLWDFKEFNEGIYEELENILPEKLLKELDYLKRGERIGLWDMKKENSSTYYFLLNKMKEDIKMGAEKYMELYYNKTNKALNKAHIKAEDKAQYYNIPKEILDEYCLLFTLYSTNVGKQDTLNQWWVKYFPTEILSKEFFYSQIREKIKKNILESLKKKMENPRVYIDINDIVNKYTDKPNAYKGMTTPEIWALKFLRKAMKIKPDYINRSDRSGLWDMKKENKNDRLLLWNFKLLDSARKKNIKGIKLALKNGANINHYDVNGDTALTISVRKASYENVKYLVDHGANIFHKNVFFQDAMDYSNIYGIKSHKIIEYLIEYIIKNHPEKVKFIKDKYITDKIKKKYSDILRSSKSGLWDMKKENKKIWTFDKYIDWNSPAPRLEISKWLKEHGITKFHIQDDLTVDTYQPVDLSSANIENLPFNFNSIYAYKKIKRSYDTIPPDNGNFDIEFNPLITLKGSPESCYDFNCSNCKLKSMEYTPEFFNVLYYDGNPCSDDINQLKYFNIRNLLGNAVFNNEATLQGMKSSIFKMLQSELDDFWESQLKDKPEYIKLLKINTDKYSIQSNHISQKLYNKYIWYTRAKNVGLFDMKGGQR
jgi:ankyrin repeat protein